MAKKNVRVSGTEEFVEFFKALHPSDELRKSIEEAMDSLQADHLIGNKIEKKLWPKKYVRKYGINNLFRYRLSSGYRMIYTVLGDSTQITCVMLEVLSHKEYDKLFGYNTS